MDTALKSEFSRSYKEALAAYARGGDEAALRRAFELSRRALAQGLEPRELGAVHADAMAGLASLPDRREEPGRDPLLEQVEVLARAASHDLQEPLRKIVTFGDLFARTQAKTLDPFARDCLGRMMGAARRMSRMIDGVKSWARVMARQGPTAPVDMDGLVGDALAEHALRAVQLGGRLEIGPLPRVVGDAESLRLLFQQLVDNAFKFRGERPIEVRVGASEEDGTAVFSVKDNGVGIEPRYAANVFEPFKRLHEDPEKGEAGVGLALCRLIVERHGGRIWVESVPGRGAEFRFTLPGPRARSAGQEG